MSYLKFTNVSELVQICDKKQQYLAGKDQANIVVISNGALVVDTTQGLICWVGNSTEIPEKFQNGTEINCQGKSIVPGFVDGHTHPVWTGDRVHEFEMKLRGVPYMEIHKQGGGIGFTVNATQKASQEELQKLLVKRCDLALKNGTTTMESKSGYGLETETEMKMLKAIHAVNQIHPISLVSTYLGAHSVPKHKTCSEYTQEIIQEHLPELKRLLEKGEISVSNIDVFLEKGVFGVEETRQVLAAGAEMGLKLNFHGDEINPMNSGELGGELGAEAISHLERVSDQGIEAMARKPTVAVLLPTTAYILHLEVPPARKMIEKNVPVALGSDFNPNAHCISMPFVMNLACITMKMEMNESLVAATLNSAHSLGLSHEIGSLEVGKKADFLVVDAPKWEHLIYQIADSPIEKVYKNGKLVWEQKNGRI